MTVCQNDAVLTNNPTSDGEHVRKQNEVVPLEGNDVVSCPMQANFCTRTNDVVLALARNDAFLWTLEATCKKQHNIF